LTKTGPKRSKSPEKIQKQVTWTPQVNGNPELKPGTLSISMAPKPIQIKQYMNLMYNSKEAQTEEAQPKALVDSKVSQDILLIYSPNRTSICSSIFRLKPSS